MDLYLQEMWKKKKDYKQVGNYMIYILSDNEPYSRDIEDVVIMASTKIDDVLEYLYNNIDIKKFLSYTIFIIPENDDCVSTTITPCINAYNNFVKYDPQFYLTEENLEEYHHIKDQLYAWCAAIKEKLAKERAEANKLKAERKEKEERELYEKLKEKFDS